MRNRIASAYKNPAVRFIAIALLAGTAAGCSSDATRFDSFYASADNLRTNSIQSSSNAVNGRVPTPSADVETAGALGGQSSLSDPLNQPMPPAPRQGQVYGSPIASSARTISDSPVQSASLSAPLPPATSQSASRPIVTGSTPASRPARIQMTKGPDPVSTATVPAQAPKVASPKQVAELEQKAPARVPLPTQVPHQEAIVPKAPQPEKKKQVEAEAKDGGATYKVASGDSLISIARKHGTTVDALRAANGLTSNAVRAGQDLKIPSGSAGSKVAEKSAPEKQTDAIKTASVPAEKAGEAGKPNASQPPVADAKESVGKAADSQVASIAPAETGIGKFRWPVTGAVIAAFGANVDGQRNDGIDISVPEGTPVKAAENGVVIYAGNGLEKLGNTVLIRHADGKVTVYAHLKSIGVNRGDKVTRGQVVADSGMTGNASRPKLHFEVRKNSSPVNPMSFLE